MPAVTLRHGTPQRSQNCGVRIAVFTSTLWVLIMACGLADGVQPCGRQLAGGMRTRNAPNIMKQKYRIPSVRNVSATPTDVALRKWAISMFDSGDATIAPPPNPMIASPVAMPGRSGNQRINVETGEM